MPVVRRSYTCMRYVPMLRMPVSGSRVITSGSVMNGPPSSGQVFRIGSSSRPPSIFTTSWHGASLTVFGIRSVSRLTSGISFSASMKPLGIGGVVSSSISSARSSSCSTPSARQMRDIDPNRLAATGIDRPGRPLEQQRRPAAGRLADAIDHRGDLEVRTDRLADARQLLRGDRARR